MRKYIINTFIIPLFFYTKYEHKGKSIKQTIMHSRDNLINFFSFLIQSEMIEKSTAATLAGKFEIKYMSTLKNCLEKYSRQVEIQVQGAKTEIPSRMNKRLTSI
jgi:hypothetical protein